MKNPLNRTDHTYWFNVAGVVSVYTLFLINSGTNHSAELWKYVRRRTKRFYVGGFLPNITESVITEYVRGKGPKVTKVSIFRNKRNNNTIARVNVEADDCADLLVSDPLFSPKGIRCRTWLPYNAYRNRSDHYTDQSTDQRPWSQAQEYTHDNDSEFRAWPTASHNRYRVLEAASDID